MHALQAIAPSRTARSLILSSLAALALAGCAASPDRSKPVLRFPQVSPHGELLGTPTPDRTVWTATLGAWFDRADTDRDGRLTKAEIEADAMRAFALFDANGDGQVTAAELTAYRNASPFALPFVPERQRRRGPPPPVTIDPSQVEAAPSGERGGRARLRSGLDPVMSADVNADFRVTAAEFRAHAAGRLAVWDRDGDGVLTKAEFLAFQREALEFLLGDL